MLGPLFTDSDGNELTSNNPYGLFSVNITAQAQGSCGHSMSPGCNYNDVHMNGTVTDNRYVHLLKHVWVTESTWSTLGPSL